MSTLDALRLETGRTSEFLASLEAKDWSRPTRCEPLTVLELVAHTWRGASRIMDMLKAKPADSEPEKDGVTYFQYDRAAVSPGVVSRAQIAAAEELPDGPVADAWRASWNEALDAAAAVLAQGDPVLPGIFGLMHLSEYLRTRVVEVTIHTMDFRDALALEPDPTPDALEATCDVLRGLLGTDLRRLGVDDLRFALTGTGRAPLTDAERALLGPLADSFPLLS